MMYHHSLLFALTLAAVLATGLASAECYTFYGGLCPGSYSCQCTMREACGSVLNRTNAMNPVGGCSGVCRAVVHDQCTGPDSCMKDGGVCGGAPPPPSPAFGAGANGTVAMGATMFNNLFDFLTPTLESVGTQISIGPENGTHWSVHKFKLDKLKIGSLIVTFVQPNKLRLTIQDLTIGVPKTKFQVFAHIFDKMKKKSGVSPADFKVYCDGTFQGNTTGASGTIDIVISTNSHGKMVGTVLTPVMNVGTPDLSLKLDGICSIAGAIIDLFKKEFPKFVDHELNELIPSHIQTEIQYYMSKYLPMVPLNFVTQPEIVDDNLQANIQILGSSRHPWSSMSLRSLPALVQPHIFLDRDFSLGISTTSFDNVVAYGASQNLFDFSHTFTGKYNTSIFAFLIPKVYWECQDCPFALKFSILSDSPPTATFGNDALQLDFTNALINFTALSNTTGQEENLFSVFTNLSFGITNLTVKDNKTITKLKFDMDLTEFSMVLGYSFIGSIDVSLFATFVQNSLKDLIIPLFNDAFPGLPLDLVYDGMGLIDWKVDLHQDAITLGANLLLPGETYHVKQTTCTDSQCLQGCQTGLLPTGSCVPSSGGGSARLTCHVGAGYVTLDSFSNSLCGGSPSNTENINLNSCLPLQGGGTLEDQCLLMDSGSTTTTQRGLATPARLGRE